MSKDTTSKKTETKKSSSEKVAEKADQSADSGASSNSENSKSKGAARTTSYFSSVSTDEYREGWQSIFGKKSQEKTKKGRNWNNEPKSVSIKLSSEDVGTEIFDVLKDALLKKAKENNITVTKAMRKNKVSWTIEGKIKL